MDNAELSHRIELFRFSTVGEEILRRFPYVEVVLEKFRSLGSHWQDEYLSSGRIAFTDPIGGDDVSVCVPHVTSWNALFITNDSGPRISLIASIIGVGMPIVGILIHDVGVCFTWTESNFNFS